MVSHAMTKTSPPLTGADTAPTIQSLGPPPERHAARVVAEMCRWLDEELDRLNRLMCDQIEAGRSRLGNPVAQQRFVERIRKAGGKGVVELRLTPGKRGRFRLRWVAWRVLRKTTERPQLACTIFFLDSADPGDAQTKRMFTLTHHAQVRLAERCGAQTPNDLLDALEEIYRGVDAYAACIGFDINRSSTVCKLPVRSGVAVIERTPDEGLVVKTVLPAEVLP